MHTHGQHFLVMAAVEDADAPARRQGADDAPEEVVSEVLRTRHRERCHLHALRVHARHHVLDRAILAGGVHRLEAAEHRPAILSV
jgi:hypothetical protein